jgi:hypothetical protein
LSLFQSKFSQLRTVTSVETRQQQLLLTHLLAS